MAGPQRQAQTTRESLVDAGLDRFAERGYEGSRLVDIAKAAGVTTGAFYGHFESKIAFFDAVFERYAEQLLKELADGTTLEQQFATYLRVSTGYRGAIRAGAELLQRHEAYTDARRKVREDCATMIAWQLRTTVTFADARVASRLIVDILDQYALAIASHWIPEQKPEDVARALAIIVERGVYRT
jgi:AcrR family transcriptional regulator